MGYLNSLLSHNKLAKQSYNRTLLALQEAVNEEAIVNSKALENNYTKIKNRTKIKNHTINQQHSDSFKFLKVLDTIQVKGGDKSSFQQAKSSILGEEKAEKELEAIISEVRKIQITEDYRETIFKPSAREHATIESVQYGNKKLMVLFGGLGSHMFNDIHYFD